MVEFSTIKDPEILEVEKNSSSIMFALNAKCYYTFNDFDKFNDFNLPQSYDDPFDCEYYYYKWRRLNSVFVFNF